MKYRTILCFLLVFGALSVAGQTAFVKQQLKYTRVRTAKTHADAHMRELYKAAGVTFPSKVLIRAFKAEKELELWALKGEKYVKIVTWPICSSSGELGPKVRQGDGQVPEGFYTIDRFNPSSNFYLSLGVSYPNKADKIRNAANPGGDIFIHGNCVTIGCIPITDSLIEYLYWTCVQSYGQGNSIPVHIFPARLTEANLAHIKASSPWKPFWLNLAQGYTYFEQKRTLPKVTVNTKGEYVYQ